MEKELYIIQRIDDDNINPADFRVTDGLRRAAAGALVVDGDQAGRRVDHFAVPKQHAARRITVLQADRFIGGNKNLKIPFAPLRGPSVGLRFAGLVTDQPEGRNLPSEF